MSDYIHQYTDDELFQKSVDQAALILRAPHLPANKNDRYNVLVDAIVVYHSGNNSSSITKALLEAAGATGPSVKTLVDAL